MFVKILFFKKVLISNPDTVTMSASYVKYSKPCTFQDFFYNDLTNEIEQARKSLQFGCQTELPQYLQNSLVIFLFETFNLKLEVSHKNRQKNLVWFGDFMSQEMLPHLKSEKHLLKSACCCGRGADQMRSRRQEREQEGFIPSSGSLSQSSLSSSTSPLSSN